MDAVIALIKQAHAGDKDARDKLISDNLGLVWSIVKRFEHRGHEREELFQIGCIGLMKAIDKFEVAYEVKFSTYAVPMIMGEIKRFLRDSSMMKVSRSLKENGWKVKKASDRLSQAYGRDATLQEISQEIGLSVEDIVEAIEANEEVGSIYQPIYQSDDSEIYLVDQVSGAGISKTEELVNHLLLEQLLGELDEKEKELIDLRYFKEMTQVQVAAKLGVSQVQVSRMERKILKRMKKASER
ncbi:MAG: SigB/SigF/SigG family RNA polymerase sigma factor [Eubacterium sp.]|jgi:RNA polymerase sporulation-specific sigma factor|nr:SigB/SigF/SigG family RNA polymerase sigma factor [Eubacterium sp.]